MTTKRWVTQDPCPVCEWADPHAHLLYRDGRPGPIVCALSEMPADITVKPFRDECRLCAVGGDASLPEPSVEFHPECGLRSILGGIGHLTNHALWCVRKREPDMGLSYRESALRVAAWVRANGTAARSESRR